MKVWFYRFLLLGFTLLLTLVAAEVIVRFSVHVPRGTPYVRENPETVYINKAGVFGHHISPGEFDCTFTTDARGFRRAVGSVSREDAARILCLGDSFTFGVGANDDQSWPAQLGSKLSSSGHKVDVINAGVQGWGLPEYWIWTKLHAAELNPKLIVVGCHASDWENTSNGLVSLAPDGGLENHPVVRGDVSRLKSLADKIPLYDWITTHSALAALAKLTVVRVTREGTTGGTASMDASRNLVDEVAPINKALLNEMKRLSENMGAQLLVVFIPSHGEMSPDEEPHKYYRHFRELVQVWTSEGSIPYLDATPILLKHLQQNKLPVSSLYHVMDGHCTPLGYDLIAEGVANIVRQHPDWLAAPANP